MDLSVASMNDIWTAIMDIAVDERLRFYYPKMDLHFGVLCGIGAVIVLGLIVVIINQVKIKKMLRQLIEKESRE